MQNEYQPIPTDTRPSVLMDTVAKQIQEKIGQLYDAEGSNPERVELLLSQLEYRLTAPIDEEVKDRIRQDVLACERAENRDSFIAIATAAIEPLLQYQREHPKETMQAIRREFVERENFTPLNDVLSYGRREDGETLHLHLAPASDLHFREEAIDGLRILAQRIKDNPKEWETFRTITATSFIVAKNPHMLELAGFTIEGPVSDEFRQQYFPTDSRPIGRATMSRETLLARYGGA